MSTLTSSPPMPLDSSPNFLRSTVESIQDRPFSPGKGLQRLPRILPNDPQSPSTSHSSFTPTDPRSSPTRNHSVRSPNHLPSLIHESSDMSKSSTGSNLSSGSTAASSLYGHRNSEDGVKTHETKSHVVLPPLSTVARLPLGVLSLADHAFRPSPSSSLGLGSVSYGSQQTSQSSFSHQPGMYFPYQCQSTPSPWMSGVFFRPFATFAKSFHSSDAGSQRQNLRNVSTQQIYSEDPSDASEPTYSSSNQHPDLHQPSSQAHHPPSPPVDLLVLLAEAANANRDEQSLRQ